LADGRNAWKELFCGAREAIEAAPTHTSEHVRSVAEYEHQRILDYLKTGTAPKTDYEQLLADLKRASDSVSIRSNLE
jgi:hypothetical protein